MKKWFQILSFGAIGLVFSLSNQSDPRPAGEVQGHERQESAHNCTEAIKNTGNFKSPKIHPNYGKIPLYFIPNKGQADARALFYARTSSYTLWITKGGLVFDSTRREKGRPGNVENTKEKRDRRPLKYERDVSRLLFLRANKAPEIAALEPTEHRANYLSCAYLAGYTISPNFPVFNAFDSTWNGIYDAYVTKFSAKGDSLIFSTYLGGRTWDFGTDIAVDSSGCAYVVGDTDSWDFPIKNAYQSSNAGAGGSSDIFIAQFSPSGNSLIFSTYFGGAGGESDGKIALDESGNIYVMGETASENFPLRNAFDSSLASWQDLFVASFCLLFPPPNFAVQRLPNNFIFYKEYVNRLTWQPNPENKINARYKIYRKPLGAPDSAYKLIIWVKENVFQYDDRTLKKNDLYSYRIASVDEKGHESEPLEAHN